jgi:hypothetical protein
LTSPTDNAPFITAAVSWPHRSGRGFAELGPVVSYRWRRGSSLLECSVVVQSFSRSVGFVNVSFRYCLKNRLPGFGRVWVVEFEENKKPCPLSRTGFLEFWF